MTAEDDCSLQKKLSVSFLISSMERCLEGGTGIGRIEIMLQEWQIKVFIDLFVENGNCVFGVEFCQVKKSGKTA